MNTTDPFYSNTQTKNNIPTKKVKKVKKINTWWFLIWCIFFFLIFSLLIITSIILAIKNPNIFTTFWIKSDNLKSFLTIFTSILFWLILFISFIFFLIWLIKSIKSKTWRWKYIFTAFIWFIIIIFTITWWIISFLFIQKIKTSRNITSNEIAYWLIIDHTWKPQQIPQKTYVAPSYFKFFLNKELFKKQIQFNLQWKITDIKLDCWNQNQILNWWIKLIKWNTNLFEWECFYINKWEFNPSLIVDYITKDWLKETKKISLKPIKINSQITININWEKNENLKLNSSKNTIIWWPAPVEVFIDSQEFFNNNPSILEDWKVYWFLSKNEEADIKNKYIFKYTYDEPWLYTIKIFFPTFKKWFTLAKIIVWPKTVSNCKIDYINRNWYILFKINPNFENYASIDNISFKIIDIETNKIVDKIENTTKKTFNTRLKPWTYQAIANINLNNWKTALCKSEKINIIEKLKQVDVKIYTTNIADTNLNNRTLLKEITFKDNNTKEITINKIPSKILIKIDQIVPYGVKNYNISIEDKLWNNLPSEDWFFIAKIKNYKPYKLIINIKSKEGEKYTYKLIIKPSWKKAQAILKANPTTWYEPLTVEFDWTQSKIQPDDEIVYFTWDFGDGKIIKNSSVWKLTHTYYYDYENENWVFIAKLTIETKNWYKDSTQQRITVKKAPKNVKIISTSHPSQIAKVWDTVNLKLIADWSIKRIKWDFWNWNTYSCKYRTCDSIPTVYEQPWTYIIKAEVEFFDWNMASWTFTLKVIQ